MPKRPDPHSLLLARIKASKKAAKAKAKANERPERFIRKWAAEIQRHLNAGDVSKAWAALRKAEYWESKLK